MASDEWAPSQGLDGGSGATLYVPFVVLAGLAPLVAACGGSALGLEAIGRLFQFGLVVGAAAWAASRRPGVAVRWGSIAAGVQTAPMFAGGALALFAAFRPGVLGASSDSPNIEFIRAAGQFMVALGVLNAVFLFLAGTASGWATEALQRSGWGSSQRFGLGLLGATLLAGFCAGSVTLLGSMLAEAWFVP